jgi:hypothetical protein
MDSIEILLKEYDTLRQEIIATISSRSSILSFGVGTIGVLLTAGMATGSLSGGSLVAGLILILLVPAMTNFILFMWLGEYERMQRAGRFLAELEGKINKETQPNLLTWETNLRKKRQHMDYPYTNTILLLIVISFFSMIAGLVSVIFPVDWKVAIFIVGILIHVFIYWRVTTTINKLQG